MDKITEQMLRMAKLSDNPVNVRKLEPVECEPVGLTEQEWKDTAMDQKIVLEGKRHVVAFQNTFVLKPVTIKTDDKGKPSTNSLKDYEKDGGDAEKTNKKMIDNVKDGGTTMVKESDNPYYVYQQEEDGTYSIWEASPETGTRRDVVDYADSKDEAMEKIDRLYKGDQLGPVREGRDVGPTTDDQREAGRMVHDHLTHGKKKYGYSSEQSAKEKEDQEYQELKKKKEEKKDADSFIKSSALKNASIKIGEQYENKQEFDDTDADEYYGLDRQREDQLKVPRKLTTAINSKIKEISASIDHYDDKGYNDGDGDNSNKIKAINALEQIKSNLSLKNEEGLKQAQLFFQTLMSPITDLFPAMVVSFLANGSLESPKDGGTLDAVEPFETKLKESFSRKSYMFTNKNRFDTFFKQEELPQSGVRDPAEYREHYINYVDSLVRDGKLPQSAVDWTPPTITESPVKEAKQYTKLTDILQERKKQKSDPCWKGYEQIGSKKGKGGKKVPNCAPKEEK